MGRGREASPIWDWKSLGSRDRADWARPAVAVAVAVAGEEGEELRARGRAPARRPRLAALPGSSAGGCTQPGAQPAPSRARPKRGGVEAAGLVAWGAGGARGGCLSSPPLCRSVYNMATCL